MKTEESFIIRLLVDEQLLTTVFISLGEEKNEFEQIRTKMCLSCYKSLPRPTICATFKFVIHVMG